MVDELDVFGAEGALVFGVDDHGLEQLLGYEGGHERGQDDDRDQLGA